MADPLIGINLEVVVYYVKCNVAEGFISGYGAKYAQLRSSWGKR